MTGGQMMVCVCVWDVIPKRLICRLQEMKSVLYLTWGEAMSFRICLLTKKYVSSLRARTSCWNKTKINRIQSFKDGILQVCVYRQTLVLRRLALLESPILHEIIKSHSPWDFKFLNMTMELLNPPIQPRFQNPIYSKIKPRKRGYKWLSGASI